MTKTWDASQISTLLFSAFVPNLPRRGAAASTPPTAVIDVLITFDADGVSGHPNHISLYHGAKAFVAALVHGKPGRASPVDLYTLKSVSLLRKYISVLDVFATLMTAWGQGAGRGDMAHPDGLVFMPGLSGTGGVSTAWRAMTRAHRSQMVWFRYGWIAFSRFMVMNDLWLENKPGRYV